MVDDGDSGGSGRALLSKFVEVRTIYAHGCVCMEDCCPNQLTCACMQLASYCDPKESYNTLSSEWVFELARIMRIKLHKSHQQCTCRAYNRLPLCAPSIAQHCTQCSGRHEAPAKEMTQASEKQANYFSPINWLSKDGGTSCGNY